MLGIVSQSAHHNENKKNFEFPCFQCGVHSDSSPPPRSNYKSGGGVRVRGVWVYSGTCLFAEDRFILNHICAMPVKIKTEINIFVDWNRDMAHKKESTYL